MNRAARSERAKVHGSLTHFTSTRSVLVLIAIVLTLGVMLALAACKPATGQPLRIIHAGGQMDKFGAADGSICITCHNVESVIKSTANYGGLSGLNVHEPPASMLVYYDNCVTCHRIEAQPVLTCNTGGCHDYQLPEGWK